MSAPILSTRMAHNQHYVPLAVTIRSAHLDPRLAQSARPLSAMRHRNSMILDPTIRSHVSDEKAPTTCSLMLLHAQFTPTPPFFTPTSYSI